MAKPALLVIAGCNGSGKSTYSKDLVPHGFTPFDYDIQYLKFYRKLLDTDVRDVMAHNMARQELEIQVHAAIANRENFCYETNFNSTPLYWPGIFKKAGFMINMIYLCMESIAEAKKRVEIRVLNKGHYVAGDEITKRYSDGFANVNLHFKFFDEIDFFDSSGFSEVPSHLLSLEKGKIARETSFPTYLKNLLPAIARLDIK